MSNTVEELFKAASDALDQHLRIPAIFQKYAERGIVPQTEEEAAELLKIAEEVGDKLATGELAPIPLRELEENGTLSKHASELAKGDLLKFADHTIKVDGPNVHPNLKKAAAIVALVGVTSE